MTDDLKYLMQLQCGEEPGGTYKKLQELENSLVCENIERVPRQWVNYRQSVNLVLQQR